MKIKNGQGSAVDTVPWGANDSNYVGEGVVFNERIFF